MQKTLKIEGNLRGQRRMPREMIFTPKDNGYWNVVLKERYKEQEITLSKKEIEELILGLKKTLRFLKADKAGVFTFNRGRIDLFALISHHAHNQVVYEIAFLGPRKGWGSSTHARLSEDDAENLIVTLQNLGSKKKEDNDLLSFLLDEENNEEA